MKKEFVETEVLGNKKIGGNIYILEFKNVFSEMPRPGQFITLEPLNKKSSMPRPYSIVYADGKEMGIIIKAVGENSRLYSKLKKGNRIRISGPLGQPFILSDVEEHIFVAGGIGIAALLWLIVEMGLKWKEFKFLFGAKTKEEEKLIRRKLLDNGKNPRHVKTISEEGQSGGTVVDLLRRELKNDGSKSIVVACGPKGMLRAVAEIAKKHGNKCFASLEEIMACGVGSCKGCAVFGVDGTVKHVCKDGPFFNAEWVDWEKIIIPKTPALRKSRTMAHPMSVVLRG